MGIGKRGSRDDLSFSLRNWRCRLQEKGNISWGPDFCLFFQGGTFGHIEFEVPGRHLRSFTHPVCRMQHGGMEESSGEAF